MSQYLIARQSPTTGVRRAALPPDRAPPSLAALHLRRGAIDQLLEISPSGQATLGRVAGDPDQALPPGHRLGLSRALSPFEHSESELSVADVLVLGRWWKFRRPA